MSPSLLETLPQQIEFARRYTLQLLEDAVEEDWYRIPAGHVSNLAWQAGHLAVAQYGLCLFRIRGRELADAQLLPSAFRKKFGKGTTPQQDPEGSPSPEEILQVMEQIHRQSLQEIAGYSLELLSEPVEPPRAVYENKFGALLFCSHHEMMHAGQIGALRRALGKQPLR